MVEDRVADPKRIAQLLASELSGLERGPLAAVTVADSNPDAEPSAAGTAAYRIHHRESPTATVVLYPDCAAIRLDGDLTWPDSAGDGRTALSDGVLRVESGAAVKSAVDTIEAILEG